MKKLFASNKGIAAAFDTKETVIAERCKDKSISITSFRCNAWIT
jgi:hypothetical protein